MQTVIYEDEWYPVLTIYKDTSGFHNDDAIEIDDEIIQEWDELMISFKDIQQKLKTILKEHNNK